MTHMTAERLLFSFSDQYHVWPIAFLACAIGAFAFVWLGRRAIERAKHSTARVEVIAAVSAASFAVWAGLFFAIAGYQFPGGASILLGPAIGSGLVLLGFVGAGLWLSTATRIRGRHVLGGLSLAAGLISLHILAFFSLELHVTAQLEKPVLSIGMLLTAGLCVASLKALSLSGRPSALASGLFLLAGMVVLHVVGSACLALTPLETVKPPSQGLDQTLVLGVIGVMSAMVAAVVLSIMFGNDPRKLWRRNVVALFLLVGMSLTAFFISDHSTKRAAVQGELSRVIAEQMAWRSNLAVTAERQIAEMDRGRSPQVPAFLHNDLHAFHLNNERVKQLLASPYISETLRSQYLGTSDDLFGQAGSISLESESDHFYRAIKSTFGLGSRYVDYYAVDGIALEDAYVSFAYKLRTETDRSTANSHLMQGLALGGGLLVFFLQGFGIFLPAHRLIVESLDALKAEKVQAERLAMVLEKSSEIVVLSDLDGRITWANKAFERVMGHKISDVIGDDYVGLIVHPEADLEQIGKDSAPLYEGHPIALKFLAQKANGAKVWIHTSVTPVFDEASRFREAIHISRDISHDVELQEELARHRDHLTELVSQRTQTIENQALELEKALAAERELNQMQTEFVSMASHEFRTPLTIIDGVARRLEKRADRFTSDDIREKSDNIRSAVKRMTMLVERTLDASRLSSGRIKLTPEEFPARTLIDDVCNRQREVASGHQIDVNLEQYPDTLFGDGRLLDNVFTNVLSNAVKYSKNNPIVKVTGYQEDGYAVLKVQDFGVGIPEDELPKIFQRFFRATTSTGIPGTGIGLNLVKNLVEMHHGHVSLASKAGEWTEFGVMLPLESPLRAQQSTEDDNEAQDSSTEIVLNETREMSA